jgi:hypothetical protein
MYARDACSHSAQKMTRQTSITMQYLPRTVSQSRVVRCACSLRGGKDIAMPANLVPLANVEALSPLVTRVLGLNPGAHTLQVHRPRGHASRSFCFQGRPHGGVCVCVCVCVCVRAPIRTSSARARRGY